MSAMFTKDTVVLDVTSSRVTAIVGCKKALSVYDIKARTERSYDGYADGEFFDADGAAEAMTSALCEVIDKTAVPAKRVYIGVPGEFVTLIDRPVTVTLDRVRRVVDADIDYLIAKGGRFDYAERVLIGSSPVCYTVDTSDRSFLHDRGQSVRHRVLYACRPHFYRSCGECRKARGFPRCALCRHPLGGVRRHVRA